MRWGRLKVSDTTLCLDQLYEYQHPSNGVQLEDGCGMTVPRREKLFEKWVDAEERTVEGW